jgi:hypothetical protein
MAEWTSCPECGLKHSVRDDRHCPRCNASIDATGEPQPPPPQPELPPPPVAGGAEPPPTPDAPAEAAPEDQVMKTVAMSIGCFNHPGVTTGLMKCDQCGRNFCSDCLIALADGVYCTGCKGTAIQESLSTPTPPPRKLTVMEGLKAAWPTVTEDLGGVWLLGFLFFIINSAASVPSIIPLVGILWALGYSLFIGPQLQAGLALAVIRKTDGAGVKVDGLFEGFKQRYLPSLIIMLPMWGLLILFMIVMMGVGMLVGGFGAMATPESPPDQPPAALVVFMLGAMLVFMLIMALVQMVMWFAFVALWEGHASGLAALTVGWRLVRENLAAALLLMLMFFLIAAGASVAGMLALCVGYLFTLPVALVWIMASCVEIYRSWSAHLA